MKDLEFHRNEYNKSIGIGFSLNEFKELMKDRKFVEFIDVKSFLIPKIGGGYGRDIEKKDIPTLIVLQKNGAWAPKNGSGGGSSGPFKKPTWNEYWDLDVYKLTDKEIRQVIKGKKGIVNNTIRFKTTKKGMRQWNIDENGNSVEVLKPKCQVLNLKSNHTKEEWGEVYNALKNKALENFSKEKNRIYTYIVNDIIFQYNVKITENLSAWSEDIGYSFYFYDEDGNYVDSINTGFYAYG